ncbi:MAG: hypothetical protein QM689_01690 [Oscillospiraceae bacterium]
MLTLQEQRYDRQLAQRVRPAKARLNMAKNSLMKKATAELDRHIKQLERENNPELVQQRGI